MNRRGSSYDSGLRERSGWLIPSAVLVAVVLLGLAFLVYYLAPNPASLIEEHTSPTARTDVIHFTVGALALDVPANYLLYPSERRGGVRKDIALFAALPDFRGYSDDDTALFAGNGANSPVVHIVIRQEQFVLAEAARFARIYMPDISDTHGARGPFGLTQYSLRDDSGYRGEDLFVGRSSRGLVVMRCAQRSESIPSPNCVRELPLMNDVALSYRFKRSHLGEWRAIAQGTNSLIASWAKRTK